MQTQKNVKIGPGQTDPNNKGMLIAEQNHRKTGAAEWGTEASGEGWGVEVWGRKIPLGGAKVPQQAAVFGDVGVEALKRIPESETEI